MDKVFNLIDLERRRQQEGIELIASENFVSPNVLKAMGSCLTNKYAEGYPGKRYYGGCEFVDQIEQLAIDRAKELFGCADANVQAHSGAQANGAIFLAFLKPGDSILGFDLSHGGHLSHGSKVNFSGKYFNAHFYGVDPLTGRIDMDQVRDQARQHSPKLIICGASSYSRDWDYEQFRIIADEVGALLMADIAHPAGLIATGLLNDPVPYCHIISTTTHKTLRGPRGGMILVPRNEPNPLGIKNKMGKVRKLKFMINSAVFPGMQGGPLQHIIAAKAVAFHEALSQEYKTYITQVRDNARAMAEELTRRGYTVVSGGTDNHLMLIDLSEKNISGSEAEDCLQSAHITVNKNMVPFDKKGPMVTSGIRIGTAAITTRGYDTKDCLQVVQWMDEALKNRQDQGFLLKMKKEVIQYQSRFPLYE